MGYFLRYVQRVGLVSTLLIGGVLGGLMAPLPSDAFTNATAKLEIDAVPGVPLTLTPFTCPSAYKLCYTLPTSTSTNYSTSRYSGAAGTAPSARQYQMQNSPGLIGKVLVKDNAGQDEIFVSGMQFVPTPDANPSPNNVDWGAALNGIPCGTTDTATQCATHAGEFHDIRLIITHTLDFTPNPTGIISNPAQSSDNSYLAVLGIGGYFTAGPTSNLNSTSANDWFKWEGRGTFKASDGELPFLNVAAAPRNDTTNLTPLAFQMAKNATSASSTSFRLDFVAPASGAYPKFACNNGATTPQCTPHAILTMSVRMYGPDSLTTTSSLDSVFGNCHFVIGEKDDFDNAENTDHRLQAILDTIDSEVGDPNCQRAKRIKKTMARHAFRDRQAAAAVFAEVGTPCGAFCAPTPDSPATNTITIRKLIGGCCNVASRTYSFIISGPSPSTPMIATTGIIGNDTSITVPADAGRYFVSEDATLLGGGVSLLSSTCDHGFPGPDTGVGSGFDLGGIDNPNHVTCTFTNGYGN